MQHVCNTRKFRVVAEYYDKCNEVGGGNLASPVGNLASPVGKAISRTPNVYVDIENKAIFDAKTGDYIGYIGKHKKMVVLKPPVS